MSDKILEYLYAFIEHESVESYARFTDEIRTDENKDYRRGFLAGRLFSQLQLKAELGNLTNPIPISTEDQD